MTHRKQAFLVGVEGNLLKARRGLKSIESENHKTLREGFSKKSFCPPQPLHHPTTKSEGTLPEGFQFLQMSKRILVAKRILILLAPTPTSEMSKGLESDTLQASVSRSIKWGA